MSAKWLSSATASDTMYISCYINKDYRKPNSSVRPGVVREACDRKGRLTEMLQPAEGTRNRTAFTTCAKRRLKNPRVSSKWVSRATVSDTMTISCYNYKDYRTPNSSVRPGVVKEDCDRKGRLTEKLQPAQGTRRRTAFTTCAERRPRNPTGVVSAGVKRHGIRDGVHYLVNIFFIAKQTGVFALDLYRICERRGRLAEIM